MSKKIFRLVNKFSKESFSTMLGQIRKERKLTLQQFAERINKGSVMAARYEGIGGIQHQLPTLEGLTKICEVLQCDPIDLLNLEWVDCYNDPEPGVIYKYEFIKGKLEWICPNPGCRGKNIEYGYYEEDNPKFYKKINKIVSVELQCEHCDEYYVKFYREVEYGKNNKVLG